MKMKINIDLEILMEHNNNLALTKLIILLSLGKVNLQWVVVL